MSSTARNSKHTLRLVQTSLLAALIIVLQVLAYFVPVGTFHISLVSIPLVIGAIYLGCGSGAFLGAIFGIVVSLACIFGTDAGGAIMLSVNPVMTIVLCIVKGCAAGFFAGVVYKAVFKATKRVYISAIAASVICPAVNTIVFCAGTFAFFNDTLKQWAAGTDMLTFIFIGLIGWNFLIEFISTIIITPLLCKLLPIPKNNIR